MSEPGKTGDYAADVSAAAVVRRPAVLVFAGVDPSGGAGISADAAAIAAQGAHALIVVTALTVQDNDRVYEVQPVDSALVLRQAQALIDKIDIAAVKIGIPGSAANAQAIAELIVQLRRRQPELPVVLDPVLASGHGDTLSRGDAVQALAPLLALATLLTPNGPEARALAGIGDADVVDDADASAYVHAANTNADVGVVERVAAACARALLGRGCDHVLITGGHDAGGDVVNRWYARASQSQPQSQSQSQSQEQPLLQQQWRWQRLAGAFHGSGCTLAAAAAGLLAQGLPLAQALPLAQSYTHHALRAAYAIAPGQRIPLR